MALTKYNYNSFDVTPVASKALAFNSDADGLPTAAAGSMVLIKTLTASSSATLSFVDGTDDVVLDSTYPIYLFKWNTIHPATNNAIFTVGFRDGDTNYDATKTTTWVRATVKEDGTQGGVALEAAYHLAQSTAVFNVGGDTGNANDECQSGEMYLFDPSSTTFIKHFTARSNTYHGSDYTMDVLSAGYCNVTAAIDAVQFAMTSGNMDTGTIKLYGISDS